MITAVLPNEKNNPVKLFNYLSEDLVLSLEELMLSEKIDENKLKLASIEDRRIKYVWRMYQVAIANEMPASEIKDALNSGLRFLLEYPDVDEKTFHNIIDNFYKDALDLLSEIYGYLSKVNKKAMDLLITKDRTIFDKMPNSNVSFYEVYKNRSSENFLLIAAKTIESTYTNWSIAREKYMHVMLEDFATVSDYDLGLTEEQTKEIEIPTEWEAIEDDLNHMAEELKEATLDNEVAKEKPIYMKVDNRYDDLIYNQGYLYNNSHNARASGRLGFDFEEERQRRMLC